MSKMLLLYKYSFSVVASHRGLSKMSRIANESQLVKYRFQVKIAYYKSFDVTIWNSISISVFNLKLKNGYFSLNRKAI